MIPQDAEADDREDRLADELVRSWDDGSPVRVAPHETAEAIELVQILALLETVGSCHRAEREHRRRKKLHRMALVCVASVLLLAATILFVRLGPPPGSPPDVVGREPHLNSNGGEMSVPDGVKPWATQEERTAEKYLTSHDGGILPRPVATGAAGPGGSAKIGQPAEARRLLETDLAIIQKLAEDHPTVTQYQSDLARTHNALGALLSATGEPAEARRSYEAARAIQQKLAEDHPTVTQYQGDLARTHNALGALLSATGQPAEALRSYESALAILQKALAIQRKLAEDHPTVTEYQSELAVSLNNLGELLSAFRLFDEAHRVYHEAVATLRKLAEDHPESPDYASGLGATYSNMAMSVLDAMGYARTHEYLREAITWQKKALAANPRNPTYRQLLTNHLTNLIKVARGLGRDDEVAEARRELAELQASDPRLEALDTHLAAATKGEAPKENEERLALAQRAYDTKRYALAARLWAEALEADPNLAADRQKQHPYNAACAAALAASGQGIDDPAPDEAAKAGLREQALGWLRAELAVWSKLIESGRPGDRWAIAKILGYWRNDTDLAGVRDADALEGLPEAEREAWRALWAGVEDLLARAKARGPGG
jgi:tetratricopeptide (TPR) repeat protein